MDSSIELSHQICIKVLVELHDSENVQLRAYLKSFTKVLRILLHIVCVNGAHIHIEILLGLEHNKEDGKLKAVPERAIDQIGFLVFRIGVAAMPFPELLSRQLSHSLAPWLRPIGRFLLELRRRWCT